MKLKKVLAFTLCLLMAFPIAGCKSNIPVDSKATTSNSSTSSNATLTPENGATLKFRTGGDDSDLAFGKAAAEKFKEKYGVSVSVEKGSLDNIKKATLEASSKSGMDVFMLPHDKVYEAIQGGILLPIDDSIVQNLNNTVNSVAMKTVMKDNKVYGVPVSMETSVLFYNKKLVKTPATTFEQIFNEAKTFNNAKQNKFWFLFAAYQGSSLYPMLSTYGFNLFGADGTDDNNSGFNTPEFLKGLEVVKKFHELMPMKASDSNSCDFLDNKFTTNNAGYIMGGPWSIKNYKKAGVDFGIIPLPTYDGKQPKVFSYIQNAHVSAYTKYPKAAQLFAQYLASNEGAELLYSQAAKITALKDTSKVKGLSTDEALGAILKAFDKSVPMPSAKRISYYWTISGEVGPEVFDGTITPAQGQKKAQQEWDSFVKSES